MTSSHLLAPNASVMNCLSKTLIRPIILLSQDCEPRTRLQTGLWTLVQTAWTFSISLTFSTEQWKN